MKRKMMKKVFKVHTILFVLTVVMLVTAAPRTATAKSVYVIADKGGLSDKTQPLQIYDIQSDGLLTFQSEYDIPRTMLGGVGMAIDSDNGFLFVTYHASEEIQLLDARTMWDVGTVTVEGARNLAGIVYDHDKQLVYCVDRGKEQLYVFDWDPTRVTLTPVPDSPFSLTASSGYGIALDEIDDLLYVANSTNDVIVYKTSNWERANRIKLNRRAISIAVDAQRGLLYTGAGYVGDMYLTQYNLATETTKEIQVEPDAGVMGLSVNMETGYIYLDTGTNDGPGGDNLQVYDTELNLLDQIPIDGDPTALVVPIKDISFNPLGLSKTVVRGASHSGATGTRPTVGIGDIVTYGIHFNNFTGATVTNVSVVDTLPDELVFVSADDDGVSGSYDPKTHSYTWAYDSWPPEVPITLELVAQVREDVATGAVISNIVMIDSKETPPTTKRFDVVAGHNPLNLTKGILGGALGQVTPVNADSSVTYVIEFDNKNEFPVTNVSVFDVLPEQISFVSAQKGTVIGKYDPSAHTCSWSLASLKAGQAVHLELEAHVKKGLAKGKIFTNIVTVESEETPSTTASAEAIIGETASTVPGLKILPEIIRRDSESYNIQASIVFPDGMGIGQKDIADVLPTLYPGDIKAKELFIYGTTNKAKVVALFDKNELLAAVKGYGEVTLQMVGMLKSGRTYSAEGSVYISKHSGN